MLFFKNNTLVKNIVIVDGQPGCGKTLFNRILNSVNKIEIYRYSSEIENICSFYKNKKISLDAAKFFLEAYADETIYSQLMSRNTNFRYSDLSSVLQSQKKKIYLKRLFTKGDNLIPGIINKTKPILHFSTHNILGHSEILFKTFKRKLRFFNIVRHPVYMIHQQAQNHIEFKKNSARQLIQTIKLNDYEIPLLWKDNPKKYLGLKNPYEKAIHQMFLLEQMNTAMEKKITGYFPNNFIKIPFESFVLKPNKFIKKIEKFLDVKFDRNTYKTMKNEKIPRNKIIDGRNIDIYKKYGWKKGNKNFSERDEIQQKIDEVFQTNIDKEYKIKLQKLSQTYEENFMKDILHWD